MSSHKLNYCSQQQRVSLLKNAHKLTTIFNNVVFKGSGNGINKIIENRYNKRHYPLLPDEFIIWNTFSNTGINKIP